MVDTEFDAIKARHYAWNIASECNDATRQCHIDRATLIALLDALPDLLDELERLREATAWRPIETAPWGLCLFYGPDYNVRIAERVGGGWYTDGGDYLATRDLTHWHPLPAAPFRRSTKRKDND